MAAGDIKVVLNAGVQFSSPVDDRTTSSASATLKEGEPVKKSNANYALLVADGDPEVATDMLLGICNDESTETSGAEGTVNVIGSVPGMTVWEGKATTPGNMDTAAELVGLQYDAVAFDVAAAVVTIDENEGDDPNVHGLTIIGGDTVRGTLKVLVHVLATVGNTTI